MASLGDDVTVDCNCRASCVCRCRAPERDAGAFTLNLNGSRRDAHCSQPKDKPRIPISYLPHSCAHACGWSSTDSQSHVHEVRYTKNVLLSIISAYDSRSAVAPEGRRRPPRRDTKPARGRTTHRSPRPVEGEPAACVCAGGHLNLGQCQARAPAAACRRGRGPEANNPTFRRLWPDLRTQHARKNQHFGGSGLIHYPTCSQHLGAGRPTFNINISAETKQHQGRSL